MTACDHRVRDELITESYHEEIELVSDASRFGLTRFGTGRFGRNMYSLVNRYGDSIGEYTHETDGTITATFPIPSTITGDPQLYAKLSSDYNRLKIPRYSATEYSLNPVVSDDLYLGEADLTLGGAAVIPSDTDAELWSVTESSDAEDMNHVVIKRYDNRYDYYLDYTTGLATCPYCYGTSLANDIRLSPIGRLNIVFDLDKLIQQVIKSIITPQGKNEYFPMYGTQISNMIGDKDLNGFTIRDEIIRQLMSIKRVQESIYQQTPFFFTAREILEDLIGVKVEATTDPREFNFVVVIKNAALEQRTSKTIRIS